MSAPNQTGQGLFRFGVFELDLTARELRKRGVRVKLQDQPFRVLEALVEKPGEIVTREELKDRLWAQDEFVEFDKSLNTAVQKIRQALEDSATSPRFVETVPKVGYRFTAPVETGPAAAHDPAASQRHPNNSAIAALAALLVIGIGWMLWPDDSGPKALVRSPRQLTTDAGFTAWPDISADGEVVVYASDRDGGPDLDIWLHQVDRDETIQLTDAPGDEIDPRISPDGSRVAYSSERERAVYVVSTLGGEPHLVGRNAANPRFAPDGRLAFAQDNPGVGFSMRLIVADADGSNPIPLGSDMSFLGVGNLWLPDGRLLTGGNPMRRSTGGGWFLVSADGSLIRRADDDFPLPPNLNLSRPPPFAPLAWLEPEQAVILAAREGDGVDLWKRPFSLSRGTVSGPPERFTSGGASLEYDASASPGGRVVYSSVRQNVDLWKLPLIGEPPRPAGPPIRLTDGAADDLYPVLSGDGASIAYFTSRSSRRKHIYYSSVFPFVPRRLLEEEDDFGTLRLDAEGREVLFNVREGNSHRILSVSTLEGAPRTVCDDCGALMGWSPDRRFIFHLGTAQESQLAVFDASTGRHYVVAQHPTYVLFDGQLSPDQRWMVFHARTSGTQFRQVFLSPFRPNEPTSDSDWIALTAPEHNSLRAEWSPDGDRLYYFSNQGGPYAIWAQRIDRLEGRPIGDPVAVYEGSPGLPGFSSDRVSGLGLPKMAVGPNFIIFDASERRGNVWLLEPTQK